MGYVSSTELRLRVSQLDRRSQETARVELLSKAYSATTAEQKLISSHPDRDIRRAAEFLKVELVPAVRSKDRLRVYVVQSVVAQAPNGLKSIPVR